MQFITVNTAKFWSEAYVSFLEWCNPVEKAEASRKKSKEDRVASIYAEANSYLVDIQKLYEQVRAGLLPYQKICFYRLLDLK